MECNDVIMIRRSSLIDKKKKIHSLEGGYEVYGFRSPAIAFPRPGLYLIVVASCINTSRIAD